MDPILAGDIVVATSSQEKIKSNIRMKVKSIKKDLALCTWVENGITKEKEFPTTHLQVIK